MLYNLNKQQVTNLPHEDQFLVWRQNISNSDYQAIVNAINKYIDTHDHFVSSHIPGNDWAGTVYNPIFYACNKSKKQAGFFFGLIVWHIVQHRLDDWCFYRAEAGDREFIGMTYFKKK